MPLYEHVLIARQDLSTAQAEGLIEHFTAVISDNGGKVVASEYWGVKTMAYKINKNRKGHYVLIEADAPATAIIEVERNLRLNEDVMRYMTIKLDALSKGPSKPIDKNTDDSDDRPKFGDDRGDRGPRNFDKKDAA